MKEFLEHGLNQNRRKFLSKMSLGIGGLALGSLVAPGLFEGKTEDELFANVLPHFAPKAKRVIYLFQNGAPSQLDLFDYKPKLQSMHGEDLPASIRMGQRLTGMTANNWFWFFVWFGIGLLVYFAYGYKKSKLARG